MPRPISAHYKRRQELQAEVWRRQQGCIDVPYHSTDHGKTVAETMARLTGLRIKTYKCNDCRFWHVGLRGE